MTTLISPHKSVRQFDCVVYVDAYPGPEMEDWPANVQDAVYGALEALAKRISLPVTIVASKCEPDVDYTGPGERFICIVVAAEIVIVDTRAVQGVFQ